MSITGFRGTIGRHRYLALILVIVFTVSSVSVTLEWSLDCDLMNLMAMARSMSTYRIPPMGGSHLMASNEIHYNLHLFGIATGWKILGEASGQSLYSVFAMVGIFGAMLLTFSIYFFSIRVFKSIPIGIICTLVALLTWGPMQGLWAGNYSIIGLAISGMLPQTYGFALGLLSMIWALRFLDTGQIRSGIVFSLFLALTILTHLLSAIFVVTGLLAYLSVYRFNLRRIFGLVMSIMPSVLACVLWPFISIPEAILGELNSSVRLIHLLLLGIATVSTCFVITRFIQTRIESFAKLFNRLRAEILYLLFFSAWLIYILATRGLVRTGPFDHAYIGISVLGFSAFLRNPTKIRLFLTVWASLNLLGYLTGHLADDMGIVIPYWWRLLFFAMLPLHILLGDYLYQVLQSLSVRKKSLAIGCIVSIMIVWNIYGFSYFIFKPHYLGSETHHLAQVIPADSILISDKSTSRTLAGYFGFTTVSPVLIEEKDTERRKDVSSFFNHTTSSDILRSIIDKYGASHLIIPLTPPQESSDFPSMNEICQLVKKYNNMYEQDFVSDEYILYRLNQP